MTRRALVIAIEEYPHATELASKRLVGTADAGDAFRRWFIETKHGGHDPGPDFLRYCGATDRIGVTGGTTRSEILDQADALVSAGRDSTSELYLFFSGHGFAFQERPGRRRIDVLLTSDFIDLRRGGRSCIRIDDLQEKLQYALGPGDHFYFIDACRNVVGPERVAPLPIDLVWEHSLAGLGCVLALHSTKSGEKASTKSGFADVLVSGLRGSGRAKNRIDGQRLAVTFDALSKYVKASVVDQETSKFQEDCPGVIQVLDPAPTSRLTVRVKDFTGEVTLEIGDVTGAFTKSYVFKETFTCELPPNDYDVVARGDGRRLARIGAEAGTVDLWDDRDVAFEVARPLAIPKEMLAFATSPGDDIPMGFVGYVTGRHNAFSSPRDAVFALRGPGLRPTQIARDVPALERPLTVTEMLAGLAKRDGTSVTPANIGLVLAVLGAAPIVEPPATLEHLRHLELAPLDSVDAGASALIMLTRLAAPPGGKKKRRPSRAVTVTSAGGVGVIAQLAPVPSLRDVCHCRSSFPSGPALVELTLPSTKEQLTLATHLLPNRATLLTLHETEDGELEIHQYMLPIRSLTSAMPDAERELIGDALLERVPTMYRVQRSFDAKRKVVDDLREEERSLLRDALHGKWVDPMMGILGAYELVRRGELGGRDRPSVDRAVRNLDRHFGAIPDTQVLLRLIGEPWARPETPPLVRQGLLSWPKAAGEPPLAHPRAAMIFGGMWTAWRRPG